MSSKVEIMNMALRSLGADPIEAPDEDSENSRKMDNVYDITLRSMLRAHPWSFAKKETALSLLVETPVLENHTHVFQLPADFVRLNKTSAEPDYSHKIKGRKLYSNSNAISIEYGYFCEDPNEYDAEFIDAFAARLAAELCFAITSNASLVEIKWREFKEKFNAARSANGQEVTPDEADQGQWLNSRI